MIRAGFAQVEITPHAPTPLSGFASRTGLATGVLMPLTARVLALAEGKATLVLVALDLIGIPDGFAQTIADRLGADAPKLIIAATHTHAGPPVLARAMLGAPDPGVLYQLADQVAGAVTVAVAGLRPAVLERRIGHTVGIAHNRRDPAGPVDPTLDIVTVRTPEDDPIAIWVNFACHPVVLGPDNLMYAPDFPGYARFALEAGASMPVLYTTGCAGEINLGHSPLDSIRKIGMDRRTPKEAARIGGLVAEAVLAALDAPALTEPTRQLASAAGNVPARYTPPGAEERRDIAETAARVLASPEALPGEKIMAEIDQRWLTTKAVPCMDLPVSAFTAGPVAAAFLPGEIFVETALALKQLHPGTLVVGYADANPGYIPPRAAKGGYEVDVAWRPYGAPGPFQPGMAETLANLASSLLTDLKR